MQDPSGDTAIPFVEYVLGLAAVLILHCRQTITVFIERIRLGAEKQRGMVVPIVESFWRMIRISDR